MGLVGCWIPLLPDNGSGFYECLPNSAFSSIKPVAWWSANWPTLPMSSSCPLKSQLFMYQQAAECALGAWNLDKFQYVFLSEKTGSFFSQPWT